MARKNQPVPVYLKAHTRAALAVLARGTKRTQGWLLAEIAGEKLASLGGKITEMAKAQLAEDLAAGQVTDASPAAIVLQIKGPAQQPTPTAPTKRAAVTVDGVPVDDATIEITLPNGDVLIGRPK